MAENGTTLADQLEQLAAQLGDAVKALKAASPTGDDLLTRMGVITTAQKIAAITKKPEEQWLDQSIQMADLGATRLFQSWKAFDAIPPYGQGSISYKDLAAKLDAEVSLVRRIAWVLVSVGTLKQVGEDQVENTPYSMVYANKHASGILFQVMFDEALYHYVKNPEYYEKYGRKESRLQKHNPHTFANGQPDNFVWEVIAQNPERMKDFMQSMNTLEQHLPITGFYDFSWVAEKARAEPDRVLLVDVGGGKGQALRAICKENSHIPLNRTVLQDRADVIAATKEIDAEDLRGADLQVHDFNTPQPVKGALIYWIRRCLHDYSDEDCVGILRHLADALAPDSRILIVEQIVSNPPPALVAQTDFCMLGISGKERTRDDFVELVAKAGLKVVNVHQAQGTPVGAVEVTKA